MNQLILIFAGINFFVGLVILLFVGLIAKLSTWLFKDFWAACFKNKTYDFSKIEDKYRGIEKGIGIFLIVYSIFLFIWGLWW